MTLYKQYLTIQELTINYSTILLTNYYLTIQHLTIQLFIHILTIQATHREKRSVPKTL